MIKQKQQRIAIIGAGAIGGTLAAFLHAHGHTIIAIDKNKAHIQAIRKNGLLIDGLLPEKKYHFPITNQISGTFDIIFLCVKSTHTIEACTEIKKHLAKNGVLISLQNGINNDQIIPIIGKDRYIAGIVGFGATNKGPGHITITSSERSFILGRPEKNADEPVHEIGQILSCIGEIEISDNILGDQWSKLAANCIINPFCAIYDKTFGENCRDLATREKMITTVREILVTGKNNGITITKLVHRHDLEKIFAPSWKNWKAHLFLKLIALKHGKIKSSLWQDLHNKQKTEINYLNGYISSLAHQLSLKTPMNDWITKTILSLEKERIKS